MTEPLDELMELKPTHASVLLVDPVELADRAGRSARGARRRANAFVGGMSAAGVTIAVAIGSIFIHPMWATTGASPTPDARPYPSSTPMSSYVPLFGGDGPADYAAPRLAFGELTGSNSPDGFCIRGLQTRDSLSCEATITVTGLTWAQVPWATTTTSGTKTAQAVVWGYFDGKSLRATTATRVEDTNVSLNNPVPSPAAPTAPLIACERTIPITPTGSPSASPSASAGTGGTLMPGLTFSGLEAYWMDIDNLRLMVATSGSLDTAALEVPKYWDGRACIGTVPKSGPLADLLAAAKRVRDAKIAGVTSVAAADYPGGVLQVNALANIPGLRERVVAVAGESVSLTIVPLFVSVA